MLQGGNLVEAWMERDVVEPEVGDMALGSESRLELLAVLRLLPICQSLSPSIYPVVVQSVI